MTPSELWIEAYLRAIPTSNTPGDAIMFANYAVARAEKRGYLTPEPSKGTP